MTKDFKGRDIEVFVREIEKLHEYVVLSEKEVDKFCDRFYLTTKLRG